MKKDKKSCSLAPIDGVGCKDSCEKERVMQVNLSATFAEILIGDGKKYREELVLIKQIHRDNNGMIQTISGTVSNGGDMDISVRNLNLKQLPAFDEVTHLLQAANFAKMIKGNNKAFWSDANFW